MQRRSCKCDGSGLLGIVGEPAESAVCCAGSLLGGCSDSIVLDAAQWWMHWPKALLWCGHNPKTLRCSPHSIVCIAQQHARSTFEMWFQPRKAKNVVHSTKSGLWRHRKPTVCWLRRLLFEVPYILQLAEVFSPHCRSPHHNRTLLLPPCQCVGQSSFAAGEWASLK